MNSARISHTGFTWTMHLAALVAIAVAVPVVTFEGKAQAQPFGDSQTIEGRVKSLTTAPMGEVDGAVLDDGTVIHWPPHLADRFTTVVTRGDRIKVSGWMETGPVGDTHLEVQTAVNLSTNASASADGGPRSGRLESDDSGDFAPSHAATGDVERRLKQLEDQIAQLREEIRRLRDAL